MRLLPFLAGPLAIYNMFAVFGIPMTAVVLWSTSMGDFLVMIALPLLAGELWRSTAATPETAKRVIANLALLTLCIIELATGWTATPTFVILTATVAIATILGGFIAMQLKGRNVWISR